MKLFICCQSFSRRAEKPGGVVNSQFLKYVIGDISEILKYVTGDIIRR